MLDSMNTLEHNTVGLGRQCSVVRILHAFFVKLVQFVIGRRIVQMKRLHRHQSQIYECVSERKT